MPEKTAIQIAKPKTPVQAPDFGEADPQELEDGKRFDQPPPPDFGEVDPQELEDGVDLGGAGPDGNAGPDFGEWDPQELEDGKRYGEPPAPAPDFGEADPQELEDGIDLGGAGPDGNDGIDFGEADPQELEDGILSGGSGPDGNEGIDFGEADPQELEDSLFFGPSESTKTLHLYGEDDNESGLFGSAYAGGGHDSGQAATPQAPAEDQVIDVVGSAVKAVVSLFDFDTVG